MSRFRTLTLSHSCGNSHAGGENRRLERNRPMRAEIVWKIKITEYGNHGFLECEYGSEEDGIFIIDCLIYNSQIVSIEEIEVRGTVVLQNSSRGMC